MIPIQTLALSMLATLAAGQERAPAKIAPTAQAHKEPASAQSPRAKLERGAFVEKYERDFEQALALFAQAEKEARAQGDEKTAQAAAAAAERLKARQAGASPAQSPRQGDEFLARIGNLLDRLSQYSFVQNPADVNWPAYRAIISDLSIYGAAAVPWVEELLQPKYVQIGTSSVSLDTKVAAQVLAAMGTDEANAALARALSAKDPLIRRAVTEAMDFSTQRALLEQAALDPAPLVRKAAVSELVNLEDPALLPLIADQAERGDSQAIGWIGRYAPEHLIAMIEARGIGTDFRNVLLESISNSRIPPDSATADALLSIARRPLDESSRYTALWTLNRLFEIKFWKDAPQALRLHVQEQLLADLDSFSKSGVFQLLETVGDVRAFAVISHELTRWPPERSKGRTENLLARARSLLDRLQPQDFDEVAALWRNLPRAPGAPSNILEHNSWHSRTYLRLEKLATGEVAPTSIARNFEGLEEPLRSAYRFVVRDWLQTHLQAHEQRASMDLSVLVPAMRDLLASDEPSQQVYASRGLMLAGDIESIPRLLELQNIQSASRKHGTHTIISTLCAKDPQGAAAQIEAMIRGGKVATGELSCLEAADALALFQRVWPDLSATNTRTLLLQSLIENVPGEDADTWIAKAYPDISDPRTRGKAIERFAEDLFEPAIPLLGNALEDPDAHVRANARNAFTSFKLQREALAEFAAWTQGDKAARAQIDALIALLASPGGEVVLGAVKALGAVRARSALPDLVRLLARDDEALRAAVNAAIERIGG